MWNFPRPGLNPCLLHWQADSYPLHHQGSPSLHFYKLVYAFRASLVAPMVKNLPTMQGTWFDPWVGKIPWRREWQPSSVLLPGKSHGRRSLVGCSPWDCEESDTTERLHFHFSLACIGEENGNPLQCSCLENLRDGGAWWAAVYGVAQSRTWLKRLSIWTFFGIALLWDWNENWPFPVL